MGKKSKRSKSSSGSTTTTTTSTTTTATPISDTEEITSSRRPAPALRSSDKTANEETSDNLRMEDPYEDIYEDEDDDDEYEDVYESSGEEDDDDEYMEAMAADGTEPTLPPAKMHDQQQQQQQQQQQEQEPPKVKIQSWNPFTSSNTPDTPLEMDETAYKMHHALTPEYPSLSIDILPDKHLGDSRTRFPHTITMVVGSQADKRANNKLTVLRMSDLCRIPGSLGREKTEKELDDEMLGEEWKHGEDEDHGKGGGDGGDDEEEEESSSDEEEEDEEEELDPVLEHYSFPHPSGGINRVRACPHNNAIVGCWGDSGTVSLYDVGGALDVLDRYSSMGANNNSNGNGKDNGENATNNNNNSTNKTNATPIRKMRKDPFFVYSGHSTEGYALDWSRHTPGRLATADCHGNIHIWNATHPVVPADIVARYKSGSTATSAGSASSSPWCNTSFAVEPTYEAHGDNLDNPSVEDLQWSPNEGTVLASAECGGFVRIYDVRCPGKAMISNKIHGNGADVNVIAWNRLVSNLLASGGDDGSFSVWDLRSFQSPDPSKAPKPLARFHSHRTPITSLEWHPTDESMIAVSDDHGTYIYDLSIEEDDPDHQHGADDEDGGGVEGEIPPQLLFVHSGSEMTKEVHWHPQIPSCVATTSFSGFSVFIPSNL